MTIYRYTTLYQREGLTFGGYVDATSWNEAQAICDIRGTGETVDGQLWLSKPADEVTAADLQYFCDLANSIGVEVPEAHEFDMT